MLETQFIDGGQHVTLLNLTRLNAFDDGIGQLPVLRRGGKFIYFNQIQHFILK